MRSKHSYLTIDRHNTVGSFHSVVAWIECNWLHGRWGAVKAFIPDHIASQYRQFISFRCCLDRMQSCTSSTNLTICPIFGTYKCYQPKGGLHGCFWVFTRSLAERPGTLLTPWSSHWTQTCSCSCREVYELSCNLINLE